MRIVLSVLGLLVALAALMFVARTQLSSRSGSSGVAAPVAGAGGASAPTTNVGQGARDLQRQVQQDAQRNLQQGADRALQEGY